MCSGARPALRAELPGSSPPPLPPPPLFPPLQGFALVAVISTLGSTSCYCLSWVIGRPIAQAIWQSKLDDFKQQARA